MNICLKETQIKKHLLIYVDKVNVKYSYILEIYAFIDNESINLN